MFCLLALEFVNSFLLDFNGAYIIHPMNKDELTVEVVDRRLQVDLDQ